MRGVDLGAEGKSGAADKAARGPGAPTCPQLAAIGASEPTSLADGGMSAGGAIEVARGRGARDDIRLSAVTGRGRQVGY